MNHPKDWRRKAPKTDQGWKSVITATFGGYRLRVEYDGNTQSWMGIPTMRFAKFNPMKKDNPQLWARIPDYFNRAEGTSSDALCMLIVSKKYGEAEDQLVVTRLNTFLALLTEVRNNDESWRNYVRATTPFNQRRIRDRQRARAEFHASRTPVGEDPGSGEEPQV